MQTFVINLKRATQRREFMEKQLQRLLIPYQIFDATEGKALSQEFINANCDTAMMAKHPDWLTLGMIGASLSHFYLYQHIVKNNIGMAFILEDDMELDDEVAAALRYVETNQHLFDKKEPILFYYASHQPLLFSTYQSIKLNGGLQAMYPQELGLVGSSAAYIIFKEAAEALTKVILPVRVAPDSWAAFNDFGGMKLLRCVYPPITKPAPFESQMGYTDKSFMGKIKQLFNPNNIYPISEILKARRRKIAAKMANYTITDQKPKGL
jgi:glycosyl transferase family 25